MGRHYVRRQLTKLRREAGSVTNRKGKYSEPPTRIKRVLFTEGDGKILTPGSPMISSGENSGEAGSPRGRRKGKRLRIKRELNNEESISSPAKLPLTPVKEPTSGARSEARR